MVGNIIFAGKFKLGRLIAIKDALIGAIKPLNTTHPSNKCLEKFYI